MTNLQSLEFFIPELILTITILAALITDLFVKKSKTNMIGWVLGVGLVVVGLSVHNLSSVPPTTLFLDMIVIDPFSSFMKIVIILSTLLVIVASWVNDELEKYRKGEYFTIMGIMVMGLFLMTSSVDIIMLYISIEVVSIMSFVLAAYLKLDTRSNEAGLKYVIYGAVRDIIYFDTSLYQNISEIPHMNYIFYLLIILLSLINPVFSLQERSLTAVYKTISFSLILVVFLTSVFFYSQYKNKTLSPVIYDTLKNDLNCDIKKSEFILEENYPLDLMLFFSDKVKPDYFSDCQIELKFSSLDSIPIENSDSINKTILDMTTKSFININFNKL